MKMAKRLLALALSVLMLVSLVGCGEDKPANNGEIVTLRMLMGFANQADTDMVLAEANKIAEKEIGVRLDIEWIDGSAYPQQMKMNMASGDDYDICFTGYSNKYLDAVRNGGLYDITELLEETPDLKKAVPQYVWDMATVDGKIYGVPNVQGFAPKRSILVPKRFVDKYNFDMDSITHVEQIEPYLEVIKQNEPDMFAWTNGSTLWMYDKCEEITSGIYISADADKENHKVVHKLDLPEWVRAQEVQHEWYKKGYLRQDLLSYSYEDSELAKVVFKDNGWLPGSDVSTSQKAGETIIVKPLVNTILTKSLGLSTLLSVGANSKYPLESLKMIELLNTNKEFYNLIINGIEGVHYETLEDGKIRPIPDSGYAPNVDWAFGNQFNALIKEGQDDDVWEQTEKMNEEAVKSPLLAFTLDTEPIKTEISQISAINQEYEAELFIVEGLDSPSVAEYRKKLEAAGLQKVMDEVQRQVDAFFDAQ